MLAQEEQEIGQVTDDGQIDSPLRVTRFVGAVVRTAPFYFKRYAAACVFSGMFSSRESQ